MSYYYLNCGHVVDGHAVIFISNEGFKHFKIWQNYYGKKTFKEIIEKGGGYRDEYLVESRTVKGSEKTICLDCFSEWKEYMGEKDE